MKNTYDEYQTIGKKLAKLCIENKISFTLVKEDCSGLVAKDDSYYFVRWIPGSSRGWWRIGPNGPIDLTEDHACLSIEDCVSVLIDKGNSK
jgi:hypothetical protein